MAHDANYWSAVAGAVSAIASSIAAYISYFSLRQSIAYAKRSNDIATDALAYQVEPRLFINGVEAAPKEELWLRISNNGAGLASDVTFREVDYNEKWYGESKEDEGKTIFRAGELKLNDSKPIAPGDFVILKVPIDTSPDGDVRRFYVLSCLDKLGARYTYRLEVYFAHWLVAGSAPSVVSHGILKSPLRR